MSPLAFPNAKGLAVLVALFLSGLPCAAGELTNPADCEKLPGSSASLCKREFLRTGSFSFSRLTREKECQKLRDASLHGSCREAITNDGSFYASAVAPRPIVAPPETETPKATAGGSAPGGRSQSGFVEEPPMTLEERNTQALETIATYTKVQAVVLSTLVGIGVLFGLIAVMVD